VQVLRITAAGDPTREVTGVVNNFNAHKIGLSKVEDNDGSDACGGR
jgi:hypothetical protein